MPLIQVLGGKGVWVRELVTKAILGQPVGHGKNCCQEPHHTWRISSIFLGFLMVIMMVGVIFIELDLAWGFQKYITLYVKWKIFVRNLPIHGGCHPSSWGSWWWSWWLGSPSFNWILPEVSKKYITLGVFSEKFLSRTSLYLEDVIHLPEVPDVDHDGWSHLHWTGFCLRFPKIYNTWGVSKLEGLTGPQCEF